MKRIRRDGIVLYKQQKYEAGFTKAEINIITFAYLVE